MIYLDTASTANYSDKDNMVIDTIVDAMKKYWQNPSGLYAADVKDVINICRKQVAEFIGAKSEEIYFTSGASESNNWCIRGWVDQSLMDNYRMVNIVTTPIEHKSILEAVNNKCLSACVRYCDVDNLGRVDCRALKSMLWLRDNEPTLVSIHMANNEIGTIQNIKKISDLVHTYNGIIHVDATQALPHIPINVNELGIDMMSASGHKISPVLKGIGFLYIKNGINIQPLIYGSQERKLRGGTENTFGIIGLGKAIEMCDVSPEHFNEMRKKRDYFINLLETKFGCTLNGDRENRLPNNINVTFPQNITGEGLLYTLDISDIKISTGSACNSKEIAPSHVLKGIGLSDDEATRSVRFTLSDEISYKEIDEVINEIEKTIKLIEMLGDD